MEDSVTIKANSGLLQADMQQTHPHTQYIYTVKSIYD